MDKEEQKEFIKAFKKYSEKITSSKKESEKFLIRAGIHTEKGKLSKQYGG